MPSSPSSMPSVISHGSKQSNRVTDAATEMTGIAPHRQVGWLRTAQGGYTTADVTY
jgi:hypothetical protein